MSNTTENICSLISDVNSTNMNWFDIPGSACVESLRRFGVEGIRAVVDLLGSKAAGYGSDIEIALNCVFLLIKAELPEANDAIAYVLELPLNDEVREFLFETAVESKQLRSHPLYVAKARELCHQWPHSALDVFLKHAILDGVERSVSQR